MSKGRKKQERRNYPDLLKFIEEFDGALCMSALERSLGIRRYVISHWKTGFRPLAAKWEPILREWAKTKGMKDE